MLTKVTYSMISGSVINALDYGADPTGATDSTSALQLAVDAAIDGTLFIPAGRYLISTSLLSEDTTIIFGEGASTIITYEDYPAQAAGNPTPWSPAIEVRGGDGVRISNISFIATSRTIAEETNYACAISATETVNDFVVENCFFNDMWSGIVLNSGSGVSLRPVIRNNVFTDISPLLAGTHNTGSILVISKTQDAKIENNIIDNEDAPNYPGYQIQTYASSFCSITGNEVKNPAYGSIGSGYASTCIVVERTASGDCEGTIISGNKTFCGESGIYVFDANNVTIDGNYCSNHGNGHGIFVKSYGTYTPVLEGIVVANNRIRGAGASGGTAGNGIQINECVNPIVTDNNVNGMYAGINFGGCDQVVCDGNTINGYVDTVAGGTKFTLIGIGASNNKFIISNNVIEYIDGNGIELTESAQGVISGNQIFSCNDDGINIDVVNGGVITTQPYATTVTGNRIDSCSGWGINVVSQNRCGIYSGNSIVNNTLGGIFLSDTSGFGDLYAITGNTISQNGAPGIYTNVSNGAISGNNVWFNDILGGGGTTSNIHIGPALSYITITANVLSGNGAPPTGPDYGVYIEAGGDYILVKDNVINNTVTGDVGGPGAAGVNNIIADNLL